MASPDGVQLYFGRRLPYEVAEKIFGYGIHLFLAKPLDQIFEEEDGDLSMRTVHIVPLADISPRYRHLKFTPGRNWYLHDFHAPYATLIYVDYARVWTRGNRNDRDVVRLINESGIIRASPRRFMMVNFPGVPWAEDSTRYC